MRESVAAVIIRNGCILLVQKKETWLLPGGKPEDEELDKECLSRELQEELKVSLKNLNPRRLGDKFIGIAPHIRDTLCLRVYLAEVEGEIIPSAEIKAAEWTNSPESYSLTESTKKVIHFLRQEGYL